MARPSIYQFLVMPAFQLNELFAENHLVLDLRGATAGQAIWEIVERLRESGEVSQAEKFYELVMEREEKSSTVANGGVAFPHARTDLVEQIVLGIGRSKAGVNFTGRADLVHLIFLIGVPQQMVNDYLICVGALARLLKSDTRRQALIGAGTSAEFFEELRRES
ncbi:MAG: PTS sugar transporter subunit IIA [Rhodanobacteraceae bacterium]